MSKKIKGTKCCAAAAGMVMAAFASGCADDADAWVHAPGTKGMINLDAVKKAFQENSDAEAFERRVNEIYEGDNLVIFEASKVWGGFRYEAAEDLDKDKSPSDGDDPLFELYVAKGKATLRGRGVNGYYNKSWPYKPEATSQPTTRSSHRHHSTYFPYWYGRRWGGGYYTPRPRYGEMSQHRDFYRSSGDYGKQIRNNAGFEKRMASQYGARFRNSAGKVSRTRNSYIGNMHKTGGYKSLASSQRSAVGLRSSGGIKSSFSKTSSSFGKGGGFGGFRGSSGFGV